MCRFKEIDFWCHTDRAQPTPAPRITQPRVHSYILHYSNIPSGHNFVTPRAAVTKISFSFSICDNFCKGPKHKQRSPIIQAAEARSLQGARGALSSQLRVGPRRPHPHLLALLARRPAPSELLSSKWPRRF